MGKSRRAVHFLFELWKKFRIKITIDALSSVPCGAPCWQQNLIEARAYMCIYIFML